MTGFVQRSFVEDSDRFNGAPPLPVEVTELSFKTVTESITQFTVLA